MKTTRLLCLFAFLPGLATAQHIPNLHAQVENDADYFDYVEESLTFQPGCSWYCSGAEGVKEVKASSELNPSGPHTYTAANAHDSDPQTAWVEGANGHGIGESLTFRLDFEEAPETKERLTINSILVANGYKKNEQLWEANSRIKKLLMYVNEQPYAYLNLKDTMSIQKVRFKAIFFREGPKNITFEIKEVYPGTKYQDTALSLLMFDGMGHH